MLSSLLLTFLNLAAISFSLSNSWPRKVSLVGTEAAAVSQDSNTSSSLALERVACVYQTRSSAFQFEDQVLLYVCVFHLEEAIFGRPALCASSKFTNVPCRQTSVRCGRIDGDSVTGSEAELEHSETSI